VREGARDGWRRLATAGDGWCVHRTDRRPGAGPWDRHRASRSAVVERRVSASARTDYWPSVGVAVGVEVGSVTVSVGSGVGLGARVWYSSCELVSTGTFAEVPSASG